MRSCWRGRSRRRRGSSLRRPVSDESQRYAKLKPAEEASRGTYESVYVHTVKTTPVRIKTKLNDCCVVRAAFSPRLRSVHFTAPESLKGVTLRRCGCDGGGVEVCDAPAGREVEKAAMEILLRGDVLEMRKAGRRSWMASRGLYEVVMVRICESFGGGGLRRSPSSGKTLGPALWSR